MIKGFINYFSIKIHSFMLYLSIAMHNTEDAILKANPDDYDESDKKIQRKQHRNPTLEKFYAGETDSKYVKDYYELLKKSDKFMKNATPREMEIAAYKHGQVFETRDQHYGFFDEKHDNSGKTLIDVLKDENELRRTKDDDYELINIINNTPIEIGFAKIFDVLEKNNKENSDFEYEVQDMVKKSKSFEFPIKAHREIDSINKIEQLTEFLHVKKIGFEYRQLEFFIPLKFKTKNFEDNSEIFIEISNIKNIFVKDEYGQLRGFSILEYLKRIDYNNTHEVWKFKAIEMETWDSLKKIE